MRRGEKRGEPIELDRTGMRRLAEAALLLVQRTAAKLPPAQRRQARRHTSTLHGIGETTLACMLRMAQPWRIMPEVLEKLERALEVELGAVLAGRCEAPREEAPIKRRVHRVDCYVGRGAR